MLRTEKYATAFLLGAWASAALAGETIYHAGGKGGCKPLTNYQAPADVAARDGYATGGKQVAPATMGGESKVLGSLDKVNIGLNIPSGKYLDPAAYANAGQNAGAGNSANGQNAATNPAHNVDLSRSDIQLGSITVGQDGSATLNGEPIGGKNLLPEGCE